MTEPKRIQRQRTAGWRMPENTVCVSRPATIDGFPLGNPYIIGAWHDPQTQEVALYKANNRMVEITTHAQAVELYRRATMQWGKIERAHVIAHLRGKNLACWCSMLLPCHADVLLEIANGGIA